MNYEEILTDVIAGGLGVPLSDLILLLTVIGGIIFFARGFKIGTIVLVLILTVDFIVFALLGYETWKALVLLFISIIMMALSLYSTGDQIN